MLGVYIGGEDWVVEVFLENTVEEEGAPSSQQESQEDLIKTVSTQVQSAEADPKDHNEDNEL